MSSIKVSFCGKHITARSSYNMNPISVVFGAVFSLMCMCVCVFVKYLKSYKNSVNISQSTAFLNTIMDGLFRACSQMGGGGAKRPLLLSKICQTYPAMMKLGTVIPYPKKTQKYMNHVTHPLNFGDIRIFSPEISKFCYIKKYRYRFYFDT